MAVAEAVSETEVVGDCGLVSVPVRDMDAEDVPLQVWVADREGVAVATRLWVWVWVVLLLRVCTGVSEAVADMESIRLLV